MKFKKVVFIGALLAFLLVPTETAHSLDRTKFSCHIKSSTSVVKVNKVKTHKRIKTIKKIDYEKLARKELVRFLKSKVGGNYSFGADVAPGKEWKARTFDCSELALASYRVARKVDKKWPQLPDGSYNQIHYTRPISKKQLKPGDLFFLAYSSGRVHHVGIYIGSGKFVEASSPKTGIIMTPISKVLKRGGILRRVKGL